MNIIVGLQLCNRVTRALLKIKLHEFLLLKTVNLSEMT